MANTNTYNIWIRTGEETLAGTDANVFIKLFGTTGETETLHLPERDIFSFESGSVDSYILEVPDIGDLTGCCIGHDDSEGDSGWFVVDVRVKDDETDREWLFAFNKWLGVKESGQLYECVSL